MNKRVESLKTKCVPLNKRKKSVRKCEGYTISYIKQVSRFAPIGEQNTNNNKQTKKQKKRI